MAKPHMTKNNFKYPQCRHYEWACWEVARGAHEHRGPMLIYECCAQHAFKCLNTNFVGITNSINIFLILSTIYIFIPVSGCVGRGSNVLLCPAAYNAVKTDLNILSLI